MKDEREKKVEGYKGLRLEAQLTEGTREAKTPKTKETEKGFKRPDEPEEAKEDKKMKNVNYRPNEHERYADFIEEMLKALKNNK